MAVPSHEGKWIYFARQPKRTHSHSVDVSWALLCNRETPHMVYSFGSSPPKNKTRNQHDNFAQINHHNIRQDRIDDELVGPRDSTNYHEPNTNTNRAPMQLSFSGCTSGPRYILPPPNPTNNEQRIRNIAPETQPKYGTAIAAGNTD
jgi:hypothetical protein